VVSLCTMPMDLLSSPTLWGTQYNKQVQNLDNKCWS